MKLLSAVVSSQRALSDAFDACLPEHFRVDGHKHYRAEFAPRYLRKGIEIWDIGGGNCPLVDLETKNNLNIHYVGLDINQQQLAGAPAGIYDEMFVADIGRFTGRGSADLIICQAVLEHVADTFGALASFHTILKPGGIAVIFVPARTSAVAALNRLIPEKLKRKLLATFWPEGEGKQGYRAYYDRCTAPAFHRMAAHYGFDLVEEHLFHQSAYFRIFFPAHLVWRMWVLLAFAVNRAFWAETFSMALRKPADLSTGPELETRGPRCIADLSVS